MKLDTSYVERCIHTLEKAYGLLLEADQKEIDFDMYRSACVKEFEIILEQCGKLLRKALKPYFHTSKAVDQLYFREVFRNAVNKGIIDHDLGERFLIYRDNRNNTAHDYGVNFANDTLKLLPDFISDSKKVLEALSKLNHDSSR